MTKKYLSIVLSIFCIAYVINTQNTAVETISQYGSRGTEVRNIQSRLKSWGYYNGNVDGIYGTKTVTGVKNFQRVHGLNADGVAGPSTLEKIGLPTGKATSRNKDVQLLAHIINGEARGESYTGQVAIGAVVLNRVRHPSFPNTIAGVIYQPGAFSAIDDGQVHTVMEESCIKAAQDALNGWDPSGGAIYYYNPNTATNTWIRSRPIIKRIGKHLFCK